MIFFFLILASRQIVFFFSLFSFVRVNKKRRAFEFAWPSNYRMALSLENCCCCVKFDCCLFLSLSIYKYRGGTGQGRKTQYYNSEGLLLFCVSHIRYDSIVVQSSSDFSFILWPNNQGTHTGLPRVIDDDTFIRH